MFRLQRARPDAISTCATADQAVGWYEWARVQPRSQTRANFLAATGFVLCDAMTFGDIGLVNAKDARGRDFVFKVAAVAGGSACEVEAALALCDGPHIVRCQYLTVSHADGRPMPGLLMPKFNRSLDQSDHQLAEDVLFMCAQQMLAAVNFIHQTGWVHMDLKESNVFVDHEGDWFVGDFGSCVKHGAPVTSTTGMCHPRGLALLGRPAEWAFDWTMLAVLFASQLRRSVQSDNVAKILQEHIDAVQHPPLRALLTQMRDFVGPVMPTAE